MLAPDAVINVDCHIRLFFVFLALEHRRLLEFPADAEFGNPGSRRAASDR